MPDAIPDPPVDLSFLQGTPIFGGLEAEALKLVASHLLRRVLPAGSLVLSEGEAAREMYVVESGLAEVRVHRSPPDEGDVHLATLKAGDCFGEMSLLDIQSRSASVTTRAETSLLVLRYRELLVIRNADAETFTFLVMNIAREVSRRLRASQRLLLDVLHQLDDHQHLTQAVFGKPRS
jgi:CRP-like cAMP-binding protein